MDGSTGGAPGAGSWRGVDEGWGRRAVDFATLSEPANCREYVALHEHLGVGGADRVLDIACGAGLAVELAAARGATVAGIDASARLVAVAADRTPAADVRVGDMHALPWADGSFDGVTSFRGIWALARWARLVARDPNATTEADVQALRDVGFDDRQVFAATTFVALRIAFSTVNDALGALPDRRLADDAPPAVRAAATYGRPVAPT